MAILSGTTQLLQIKDKVFHFAGKSELTNSTDFNIYAHSHVEFCSLVRKRKKLICVEFNVSFNKVCSFTNVFFPEMS